jgi:hypothetical protein
VTALVPVRTDEDSPLVSLATAGVAAMIRLDGFDRRNRLRWYVLRLAGAKGNVRGCVFGVLRNGTQIELGRLDVAAGAVGESRFAVPQPRRERFGHVYLDLRSDDLALRVEAPAPPIPQRSRGLRYGLALVLAGTLVAGGGSLALAVPPPPLIVAPLVAAAGDIVHVSYATRGVGSARYDATTDDGRTLSSGTFLAASGDIAVMIPRGLERRHVVVRVDVAGPFGASAGETGFTVVPPLAMVAPSGTPARIAAFSARREGPDSVLASYLAVAESGWVVVVDGQGSIVGRAPFSRRGTTRISIPPERRNPRSRPGSMYGMEPRARAPPSG